MTKLRDIRIADIAASDLSELDPELLRVTMSHRRTLVAPTDAVAQQVIVEAIEARTDVIISVNDAGDPEGVLLPQSLPSELAEAGSRYADLNLDIDNNLLKIFRLSRPVIFWCDKHKHYTTKLPCPA